MKPILSLFLFLFLAACSTKNAEDKGEYQEWKEMQSFHLLMAEAFHPYKDSANLEPAKALAKDMADEAARWSATSLPEKVNNEAMKAKIQNLSTGTQDFLKVVTESSADSVVAKSLSDLHDIFHEIQESWYGAGKEDHQEHH